MATSPPPANWGGVQASMSGDAVLLGDDGLIPASLLPSTSGGDVWEQIDVTSTLVKGEVYRVIGPRGTVIFVYNGDEEIHLPPAVTSTSRANTSLYNYLEITSSARLSRWQKYSDAVVVDSTNTRLYKLVE